MKGKDEKGEEKGDEGKKIKEEEIKKDERERVREIMMIREYRMRGNMKENIEKIGIEEKKKEYKEMEKEN